MTNFPLLQTDNACPFRCTDLSEAFSSPPVFYPQSSQIIPFLGAFPL